MPWRSHLLRGQRVWAHVSDEGDLVAGDDGRVEIVYRKGGKVYRAQAGNLEADPQQDLWGDDQAVPLPAAATKRSATSGLPVVVYADGACSGNPGPAGIGIVILSDGQRREISEYLGEATNNIAELTAIIRALEEIPRERPVRLYSDSAYALGLLGRGWKAKANKDLVEEMRRLAQGFSDLRLVKVEGHAGVAENERADALARQAVLSRGAKPK